MACVCVCCVVCAHLPLAQGQECPQMVCQVEGQVGVGIWWEGPGVFCLDNSCDKTAVTVEYSCCL